MMNKKILNKIYFIIFFSIILILLNGCGKKLPEDRPIGVKNIVLLNQDSSKVIFPDSFKGKTLLLCFIYTNCPDICPMTTHNMQLIQEQLKKENINNVQFAEMSFDPQRDTPSILKTFGDIRNIDYSNFTFLTGKSSDIKSILNNMNILALPGDTTKTESGTPVYFFTHTDRITLIDKDGKIRNEYRGSKADIQAVVNDIKILGD
ncbi:MAG: SCO family protein [Bacteroidetes bacterium]|nr:SCO family protein [Bacteroidota bacterium]